MIKYIAEKQKITRAKFGSYNLHGVPVEVTAEINFDIFKVIERVKSILPEKTFKNLKSIKIKNMKPDSQELPFNAYYINRHLFIHNKQDNIIDAVDDIVHEMSHHIEKKYEEEIYGDGLLAREFLNKRKMLYDLLSARGLRPPPDLLTIIRYDKKIDDYLYNEVGHKLYNFLSGLFLNEYSVTSLREYYAVGFEKYLIDYKGHTKMKKNNPVLYKKIVDLIKVLNEKNEK